jgi:hypothetical protein
MHSFSFLVKPAKHVTVVLLVWFSAGSATWAQDCSAQNALIPLLLASATHCIASSSAIGMMVKVYSSSPTPPTERMQKRGILAAVAYGLTICPEMENPTMIAWCPSPESHPCRKWRDPFSRQPEEVTQMRPRRFWERDHSLGGEPVRARVWRVDVRMGEKTSPNQAARL